MDASAPTDIEVACQNRPRSLRRAIVPVIIAVPCGVLAAAPGQALSTRGPLIAFCLLFGIISLARLWSALGPRRVALSLEPDGFRAPSLAQGLVPWTAIACVTPVFGRSSSPVILSLHPGAEASFVPSRWRRVSLRLGLSVRTRLYLDLAQLDARPAHVLGKLEARIRAAQGLAPEQVHLDLPQPAAAAEGRPFFAYALIGLLAAIFAAEVVFAIKPSSGDVDVATLGALGATSRAAVLGEGEWWRLVTASLLHAGFLHITFNSYALVYAARLLERRIGWRWFAACFALSAIGGSLASLALNAPNVVGAGASGGIVGLSATTAVAAFRFPPGGRRKRLLFGALNILVPSILPFLILNQVGNLKVDVAAHIGGAIAGALVGLLLLRIWRHDETLPRFGRAAALVAAAFFAVAAASLVPIIGDYATIKSATNALAPDFPRDDQAAKAAADDLIEKYPRDPRVRYFHASRLIEADDFAGAQRDLEAAMDDKAMLRPEITLMQPFIRGLLAIVLSVQKHQGEADMLLVGHCPELKPIFGAGFRQFDLCR